MSVLFHPSRRRLLLQTLAIAIILITSAVAQAAQVTLAWDPNDPAPDGYQVFQRIEGDNYNYSSPVWPQPGDDAHLTTCTINNLSENTNYFFVVRAYVGTDQSGDSNEVSFRFESPIPTTYTLSATAGPNGSISPGTTTVNAGDSQTFAIIPQSYYHVANVLVDGSSVGPVTSYTFSNVSAAHTISASFGVNSYTISASAGANGSISPSGTATVAYGSSRTYSISANTGYHISDVLVDSSSVGPLTSYTFSNIAASHNITAAFMADAFTISSSAGQGGTITPSGQISVPGGESQNFTLSPDEGYEIGTLVVDGVSLGAQSGYTFNNVNTNHSIAAAFVLSNLPPVADAGPDQVVDEAMVVTLSGVNSRDADDGITSFQWRQIQGDPVSLSAPGQEETTFVAPDVDVAGQAMVFELTVTDSKGATAKDTCIVNVTWVNQVPRADAGVDQTITEGGTVMLNATASADSDDGIAAFSWVQVQGPTVNLSGAQSASPFFTAPDVGPQGASLIFELTVTDAGGLQDTDSCKVTVTWANREPVAEAGSDQQVASGTEVTLDGSQSADPDGSSLLYQWRQTDGPPVILSDATAVRPVFEAPAEVIEDTLLVFELTVTDDGGLQGVDTCQVGVQAAVPLPDPDVDTQAPELSILNPAGDYVQVYSSRLDISGLAKDDRQVDRVVWVNDRGQSGLAVGTERWRISRLRLHRWENTFTITAYDTAGNAESKTITVDFRYKR